MVIVLVGNIGSGKTTFCERLLKERGSGGGGGGSGGGGGGGGARGGGGIEDGEDASPRFEVVSQDLLGCKDKVGWKRRREEGKRTGREEKGREGKRRGRD